MRTRQIIVAAALLFVSSASFASPPREGSMIVGQALVGVDELGRVAIAVDSVPTDGRADHCFLYTARQRLEGPWSKRFDKVQLFYNDNGALTLLSADRSFLLRVAVRELIEIPHPDFTERFQNVGGFELTHFGGAGPGNRLEEMSHADISTWPGGFWYDLLAPESGCLPDVDCQSGGVGATSCSQNCGGSFGSCSVTCGSDSYACCKCQFLIGDPEDPSDDSVFPTCRCRPCSLQ